MKNFYVISKKKEFGSVITVHISSIYMLKAEALEQSLEEHWQGF
jgi:hypothetical protein